MLALLLVAQLLRPTEVLEHWTLRREAPLGEEVSARGRYTLGPGAGREGVRLVLPAAVQGGPRPTAVALRAGAALPVEAGPVGWQARWNPSDTEGTVRVEATVTRPASVTRGRPFALGWPRVRPEAAPTRRVVWVQRSWLEGTPPGWTCPEEPTEEVPCVSREGSPGPVLTRIGPVPSPPGSTALGALLGVLVGLWVLRPSRARPERALAAAGGATVGAATSLAVVGAGYVGWALALGTAVPAGAAVGVVALGSRAGRSVGVGALVAVPLLAVAGAGPWVTGGVALGAALGACALAWLRPTG